MSDKDFQCPYCGEWLCHDPQDAIPGTDYIYECDSCHLICIMQIEYEPTFEVYKTKEKRHKTPYGESSSVVKDV